MARVELDLPDDLAFSTEILLQERDINYAGHLGNDRLLTLLQTFTHTINHGQASR